MCEVIKINENVTLYCDLDHVSLPTSAGQEHYDEEANVTWRAGR